MIALAGSKLSGLAVFQDPGTQMVVVVVTFSCEVDK